MSEKVDPEKGQVQADVVADPSSRAKVDNELQEYANTGPVNISPEENKRLRRMIDKRVLFVMLVTYLWQTLDKGTISFASIMNLIEDTNLQGQQYSWLTTIVYVAILVCEYPANLLLQKFPIGKLLAGCIFAWGVCLAVMPAAHNFGGLMATRFLLGAFETICQPGFTLMSSIWYRREEQAKTISLWYSMNGFQQCIGGLIAYAVSTLPRSAPVHSWQVLFIAYGCATVLWSFFVLWWLPDSPMRAKCFSEEDKKLIIERVRDNETGIQNKKWKMYQVWEALRDPKTFTVAIIQFCTALPSGGMGAFQGILINSFGFTVLETQLLAIPQGAWMMFIFIGSAIFATKVKQTVLTMLGLFCFCIVSKVVFLTVPVSDSSKGGLLWCFYMDQCFSAAAVLMLSLISRNTAGQTKKSVTFTVSFLFWAAGNMVGPQVFLDKESPRYHTAFIVHLVCYGVSMVTLILVRIWLVRQNVLKARAREERARINSEKSEKEKEAGAEVEREEGEGEVTVNHDNAFADLTDKENIDLIYVY